MIEFIIAVVLVVAIMVAIKLHRKYVSMAYNLQHANNKSNLYLWALLDTMHVVENSYGTDIPGFDKMRESIHILEDPELLEEYREEMRRNYDA